MIRGMLSRYRMWREECFWRRFRERLEDNLYRTLPYSGSIHTYLEVLNTADRMTAYARKTVEAARAEARSKL